MCAKPSSLMLTHCFRLSSSRVVILPMHSTPTSVMPKHPVMSSRRRLSCGSKLIQSSLTSKPECRTTDDRRDAVKASRMSLRRRWRATNTLKMSSRRFKGILLRWSARTTDTSSVDSAMLSQNLARHMSFNFAIFEPPFATSSGTFGSTRKMTSPLVFSTCFLEQLQLKPIAQPPRDGFKLYLDLCDHSLTPACTRSHRGYRRAFC
mmetsp:Transcript_8561/g.25740  ORF Transcript_8561/g.25740 Transcript_8561/m.25740 type:complete len:206 (-) Transcript_8561:474-1091(-)